MSCTAHYIVTGQKIQVGLETLNNGHFGPLVHMNSELDTAGEPWHQMRDVFGKLVELLVNIPVFPCLISVAHSSHLPLKHAWLREGFLPPLRCVLNPVSPNKEACAL